MKPHRAILVLHLFLVFTIIDLHAAEFVMLGPGDAEAVSDDGTVIVGIDFSTGSPRAWRWSRDGGRTTLGNNAGAYGLSADGAIVGGYSGTRWATWTTDDGRKSIAVNGTVRDVSANNEVLVGNDFLWSAADGLEKLEPLPDYNGVAMVHWTSADGNVVVGSSRDKNESEATLWFEHEQSGKMRAIGLGQPNGESTWAGFVSRDGSTVVGGIGSRDGYHIGPVERSERPFIWTEQSGMIDLGKLDGQSIVPTAIAADASLIVGNAGEFAQGFMWGEQHEIRDLVSVLEDEHGIDALSGWFRMRILAMSADARVLTGRVSKCDSCLLEAFALFLDRPLHRVPGDTNYDFDVDFEDFLTLADKFGQPGVWEDGDFDLNGTVEFADFLAQLKTSGLSRMLHPPLCLNHPH